MGIPFESLPEHVKAMVNTCTNALAEREEGKHQEMQAVTRPMRSMLEKELHKNVYNELTRRKIWFVDSRMDRPTTQRKGVPDFVCCVRGKFIAFELKRPGEGLTPDQIREFDGIKASDGRALRVTSLEEVIAAIS